ncbi:hypothetical protein BC830DRAFT_1218444 [Chytriomyces sp. MP71]|nr:hypothetical protein BC830DRAFT_1218444 [Chytriomyces sp. MP71]
MPSETNKSQTTMSHKQTMSGLAAVATSSSIAPTASQMTTTGAGRESVATTTSVAPLPSSSEAAPVTTSNSVVQPATTTAPATVLAPDVTTTGVAPPTSVVMTTSTTMTRTIQQQQRTVIQSDVSTTQSVTPVVSTTALDSINTVTASQAKKGAASQDNTSTTSVIVFSIIGVVILGIIIGTYIIRKCCLSESRELRDRRLRRMTIHNPRKQGIEDPMPLHLGASSSSLELLPPSASRPPSKDMFQTAPRRMSVQSTGGSMARSQYGHPASLGYPQGQQQYYTAYGQYPVQQGYAYPTAAYGIQQAPPQFNTFEHVYGKAGQQPQQEPSYL